MIALSVGQLVEAWERVRENAGCAGVDGVTVDRFEHRGLGGLDQLAQEVEGGSYRALPLLEIVVEPKAGKHRDLHVPTVRDRVVQTAVARVLSKAFEEEFLDASFAYRPGRSVDRAIARTLQWRDRGYTHLIAADIRAFFDSVSHRILMERLGADPDAAEALPLLEQWVRAWLWDGRKLRKLRRGIAQGGPVSPLLGNYFLSDFDRAMEKGGARLVRYGDDFLLLCKSADERAGLLEQAKAGLRMLGLDLSEEKTFTRTFEEGFEFLGTFFLRDKVYTPWKHDHPRGRVLSMAHPMPQRLLDEFRKKRPGRPQASTKPWRQKMPPRLRASQPAQEVEMAFLYLTEQGSVLRKSGDRVMVESEGRVTLDLPYHKLESVLLFGNIQVTSQAMGELLEKGVRMSLFSRHGQYRGALAPAHGKNVVLRVKQFQSYENPERAMSMARAVVKGKIGNGAAVLAHLGQHNTGVLPDRWREDFEQSLEAASKAETVAMLDGVEGAAARTYFDLLMRFNKSSMRWRGRLKHPAPDPLNALMSLTYTMLMHEMSGLLEGIGMDSYLGFLHQLDYGRPSLALDLVEAFRHAVADRFVLRLVNLGMVKGEDFHGEPEHEGVFLHNDAIKRYFAEYEKWMLGITAPEASIQETGRRTYRESLRHEAQKLAAAIEDGSPWVPFEFVGRTEAT